VDELDAGPREVCEVAHAFRVALADEDDEGRLVDDAAVRERLPVARHRAPGREPLDVALDGEDADVGPDALKDLVRDRLRPGVGGGEVGLGRVLAPPHRVEAGEDGLLHRLLHHREGVERDALPLGAAAAARRLRQAGGRGQQRAEQERGQRARAAASPRRPRLRRRPFPSGDSHRHLRLLLKGRRGPVCQSGRAGNLSFYSTVCAPAGSVPASDASARRATCAILKARSAESDDEFARLPTPDFDFFCRRVVMRKILLSAASACGAALALFLAACTAPDGAGTARNGAPATTNTRPANPPNANAAPAQTQRPAEIVRRVTPAELKGMLDRGEAVAVDVRTKDDYAGGHIKDALSLPLGEAAARAHELPKDKLVVFYCA
jgi:hypothetical protein